MVVAQIGVGQHIVADGLAFTQAAAVADHQPDIRAQHRQVVADGFGVGRADANVNQGDPFAIVGDQMPGWHLVLLPRQIGNGLLRRFGFGGDPDPAGAGEGDIGAVRIEDLAAAPADKLIHVAGIVGEQHIGLEVFRRGAGIVPQTRQRKIDAAGVKVRQRIELGRMEQAVRGFIANLRQLGGGEIARQTGAHRTVKGQGGTVYHVRVGDFMLRQLDANMGAIVLIQQGQLFE